jgi:hypothetical protein
LVTSGQRPDGHAGEKNGDGVRLLAAPDGHAGEKNGDRVRLRARARRTCRREERGRCPSPGALFVYKENDPVDRQGDVLRYALLAYGNIDVREQTPEEERRRINSGIAEVLERPDVTGWLRLQNVELATTLRHEQGRTLMTDGPFVDSKDFLGGFILVEAENLDGALTVAGELQELRGSGAIEIRPVNEEDLVGA